MTETTGKVSPLQLLQPLAADEIDLGEGLRLGEITTMEGLLIQLWHGDQAAEDLVVMLGGGMGGLLGPAGGLYHDLGVQFARDGIATVRVDYRRPGRLDPCLLDVAATVDIAARSGARRFVFVGHSFGGAVAVQAGVTLGDHTAGVVTLATQSAGCECAGQLGNAPLLLLHGDRDEILSVQDSRMVQSIAGTGEVVVLAGTGHLLTEAAAELRERLLDWIPARLADHRDRTAGQRPDHS